MELKFAIIQYIWSVLNIKKNIGAWARTAGSCRTDMWIIAVVPFIIICIFYVSYIVPSIQTAWMFTHTVENVIFCVAFAFMFWVRSERLHVQILRNAYRWIYFWSPRKSFQMYNKYFWKSKNCYVFLHFIDWFTFRTFISTFFHLLRLNKIL